MDAHAEISIVAFPPEDGTSVRLYVAAAFDAIRRVEGVEATLTALGTQIAASDLEAVLRAISAAHDATKLAGARRIISTIRIDERMDKNQTLQDKIESVSKNLS